MNKKCGYFYWPDPLFDEDEELEDCNKIATHVSCNYGDVCEDHKCRCNSEKIKKGNGMKVEFKKLYKDSILPNKAHKSDAGMDLYAHSFMTCMGPTMVDLDPRITEQLIAPGARILVKCGFSMALPAGHEAQVRPRSGLALKHGITVVNSPGTIDGGFRAEVGVILMNAGHQAFSVSVGDRIAQMVIQRLPNVEIVEVDELSDPSERGMAGFGSSGK